MNTAEFRVDPFPVLNRLREEAPVHRHEDGIWTISRYADVSAGVRNHAVFSNVGSAYHAPAGSINGSFAVELAGRRLSSRDEPDHRALRTLMNPMFFPRAMTALAPKIEAIVDGLVQEMRRKQRDGVALDFVRDFAYPLTTLSINVIVGVPDSIRDRYTNYSTAVDEAMGEYFREIVRYKEDHPGEDVTTELIRIAKAGHDLLPLADVVYYLAALWTGGTWTTTLHIANAAALLQRVPGLREQLRADESLIPAFVEEALRLDPPVLFTAKRTLADVDVSGTRIPAAQQVLFVYAAANRDPRQFADPDTFNLARRPNKHLSFSEGIHHCIGSPLARLESVTAFRRLVRSDVALEIDLPQSSRTAEMTLSGYRTLPCSVAG
ncbi:MAG: cytochrome P450 [Gammaproteobacteria bacterium]